MTESAAFVIVCDHLGLDAGTRRCLRRVFCDGLTVAEAAAELGIQSRSVRAALARYRRATRPEAPVQAAYARRELEEPDDPEETPLAEQSYRQQARHLLEVMRGPDGTPLPALDPQEGDRDRISARPYCLEDVERIVREAAWRRK
jgi:hypothetical protein